MSRFVEAHGSGSGGGADTLDDALMSLVTDGFEDVAECAHVASTENGGLHLGSGVERFTDVLARQFGEANEALRGGWSGDAHDRVFSGWRTPRRAIGTDGTRRA